MSSMIGKIIWVKNCIGAQNFKIKRNNVYQDSPNQSAMKLENNGKESNGKSTKHFLFFNYFTLPI